MENLIEAIKEVPLVDIFQDLGFKVVNRKLKCPFHEEKTASMVVYPENWYHCFGCGKHGDVFNFYQQHFQIDFKEALFQLATKYIPSYNGYAPKANFKNYTAPKKEKIVVDFKLPTRIIHSDIYEGLRHFCVSKPANETSKAALAYLHARGFEDKTIKDFQIFVIKSYSDTNDFLRNTYPLADLKESGLFNERGNLVFFKHSLLIPYYKDGRIVYLQGRLVADSPDETISKYQFLSGVPREIFNVDVLKKLKLNQKIYVTEGAFDAMILHKMGYPAISLGSAQTFKKEWAKLFKRYEVVVFFDNDPAGVQGGLDLMETLTLAGINTYRKYLPAQFKDINDFFLKNEQL